MLKQNSSDVCFSSYNKQLRRILSWQDLPVTSIAAQLWLDFGASLEQLSILKSLRGFYLMYDADHIQLSVAPESSGRDYSVLSTSCLLCRIFIMGFFPRAPLF